MMGLSLPVCMYAKAGKAAEKTEEKVVRVGWYESPFNMIDQFGRRSGYAYEYQQKIAVYTGWSYEYVEGSWPELYQMLLNGEIDLLSDVSYTPERSELMLFGDLPMGAEEYYLFISGSNPKKIDTDDITTLNGVVVGVYKDSVQKALFEEWAHKNGLQLEIKELSGSETECKEMLIRGEIDAFVTLDDYGGDMTIAPVYKIGSSDYYFAVNKNRPDLLKELDSGLNRIQDENRYYNQQMQEKYMTRVGTGMYFTNRELSWLEEHGPIRVGYLSNYLAFCAQDKKTGELTGALKDFLEMASDCMLNGTLSFETVPFKNTEEELKALSEGLIDCAFPVSISASDGENMGLSITIPQMQTEMDGIIRRADFSSFSIDSDVRVAVNYGNINYESFLMDYFPNWEKVYFDSTEEGLKAISAGKADCLLVSSSRKDALQTRMNNYGLTTFSTGIAMGFSFAIRRQDDCLYSILDKVTNVVPQASVNSAMISYSFVESRHSLADVIRENIILVLAVIAAITLVILLLLIRSRKAEKNAKMHEEATEKALERNEALNHELEENQKTLKEALAASEQAGKAKTAFLSNMSHDIRTPMNAIIGYTALAKSHIDEKDMVLDYISKISVAGDHLLALINDVLDMSRIESGRMEIQESEFSLDTLLTQINAIVSSQCQGKGLELSFEKKGDFSTTYKGDETKLKQVLINILSNAVKYTPAPGKVCFSVEKTASFEDIHTLLFTVKDTGIGISEDYLPKLFDAFSQEDSNAENKYGSTGLGMAISRNIIRLMNGDITVDSEKGVGSTFKVTVSLKEVNGKVPEEKAQGDHAEQTEDKDLSGLRVLIAEDMLVNAQLLEAILDSKGVAHDRAENGKLAVDRFRESSPGYYDVILMDIQMPEMNGLEATAAIRAMDKEDAKTIPIIAMTANAFDEDVKRSLQAGMNAHLTKPIEIERLFELLSRME